MLYTFEENFEPSEEEMAASQRLSKLVITQKYGFTIAGIDIIVLLMYL